VNNKSNYNLTISAPSAATPAQASVAVPAEVKAEASAPAQGDK
jgi:hypothetical protein